MVKTCIYLNSNMLNLDYNSAFSNQVMTFSHVYTIYWYTFVMCKIHVFQTIAQLILLLLFDGTLVFKFKLFMKCLFKFIFCSIFSG